MNNRVGPWVRRFLVEYLIGERNYSLHTQQSRRDTFVLFLPFAAKRCRCALDQLPLSKITPKLVREFVRHLEQIRHCGPSTINQRVISLRAWARFVGIKSPEHLDWSSQILTVHLKKHAAAPMNYLEKSEMKALLAAPDQRDHQDFRDYVLLLFLYNTGARASEASRLTVGDLDLVSPAATLHGKGRKSRTCPLWKLTADKLRELVDQRPSAQPVFLNRHGQALTRYGLHTLVERYARQAAVRTPSLKTKRVSPHTIRHATAMALLRSGVDINTIRVWLGHVSLQTTHIYAESDMKMKAKALDRCEAPLLEKRKGPSPRNGLMGFLKTL
jgi:site-specific recombinase XerD